MTNRISHFVASLVVSASLVSCVYAAAPAGAHTNHNLANAPIVTADASDAVVNQTFGVLQNLGMQPSGTTRDTGNAWCIFNNWGDRDQRANVEGKYDLRFSTGTTFGGRWYCFAR
jgi:hypothetical protein